MKITEQIANDLGLIYGESALLALIVLLILLDLFSKNNTVFNLLFFAGLVTVLTLSIYQILELPVQKTVYVFFDHLTVSAQKAFLKSIFTTIILLYYIFKSITQKEQEIKEISILMATQLFGAFIVVQAGSYLTLFLGIEIVSITSYVLTYLGNTDKSKVSATKYFLFGAFSSALMIYGISWVYGITGDCFIHGFPRNITTNFDSSFYYLAMICLYAGLFFKISVVPFHLWVSDVYRNIPHSILSVISLIPKLSGIIALYYVHVHLSAFSGFGIISYNYLFVISIATMLMANLIALKEKSFKGLFAFSSIAQSGLMLAMVPSAQISILIFYIVFYVLMNFAFLFIYESLSSKDEIESLSGLGMTQPVLGILMLIATVSLIGIPPFVGFIGKFFMLTSLLASGFNFVDVKSITAMVIVLTTFMSLVYYLRFPYYLFVKKYDNSRSTVINWKHISFSAILVLPLIIGFFSFDWLVNFIQKI